MTEPSSVTPVALVDLLDRALSCGVVVAGEVTLSIADVDLVQISLQALLSSIHAEQPGPRQPVRRDGEAGKWKGG